MSEAARPSHPVSPWRLGLDAARQTAGPGVALAVFALGVGLAYAYAPPVRGALLALAEWRGGLRVPLNWLFPMVTTALFGGLVPVLVERFRATGDRRPDRRAVAFLTGFWALKGLEINLLYVAQAAVFGDDPTPGVVAAKVAVDMGLYCPLWALPTTVAAYAFKDAGYSWSAMKAGPLRHGLWPWWRWDVLPVTINNAAVWLPAVAVMYCLPFALQLPFQNLVLCFWSLVLLFMTDTLARRRDTMEVAAGADG